MTAASGPYADAFDAYWRAGWRGVLPLPPRAKKNPPTGYTGERGNWPSYPDVYTWGSGRESDGNIALRMPHNIIGIDVDAYGDKRGDKTLTDAEARLGKLPDTWRSTSRDDGTSGIRLYRIPEGLAWPGELGADVELIQWKHRYSVVWPSIHPTTGATYRWITPEGVTSTAIPDPDLLPSLPDEWIGGITHGEMAVATPRNSFSDSQTNSWLVTRPGALDEPCARMARAIDAALTELTTGGSAHNAARDSALRCARLAEEGHEGVVNALTETRRAFVHEATTPGRRRGQGMVRTRGEAEREWHDLVTSAVNLVTADPTGVQTCDCGGQLTGLIVGGGLPTAGATALASLPVQTQPDTAPDPEPAAERSRTSWWPRPLDQIIAGHDPEQAPSHLTRSDGACLFYSGKINAILGESESGKTWLALLAVTQALQAGQRVVYLDFEDTATGIVTRLRALGSTDDHLSNLAYIGPDETLHAAASDDLRETLDHTQPDLVILDGWNAAMTLLGLDLDKNKDATQFAQLLLKPLSQTGSCVVAIDHLPKNKENRGKGGIGAQAKRAMVTGCAVLVDIIEPFGRGMTGKLTVKVDKDRPGHVRAISEGAKNIGTAILTSLADGTVEVVIEAAAGPNGAGSGSSDAPFRPTHIMGEVSAYLVTCPLQGVSGNQVEKAVPRKALHVRVALQCLVEEGYVERVPGARGGVLHRSLRPFYEDSDWIHNPPRPTSSHLVPDEVAATVLRGLGLVDDRPRPTSSHLVPDEVAATSSRPFPPVGEGTRSAVVGTTLTSSQCKTCQKPVGPATAKTTGGMCSGCFAEATS